MLSLKNFILETSLLDIEGQLNKEVSDLYLLLNTKSEQEYEDLLKCFLENNCTKIEDNTSNTYSEFIKNLKKNSVYIIHVKKSRNILPSYTYIGIHGKSKHVGMHWSSGQNKVVATIYNDSISNFCNMYHFDVYEATTKNAVKKFEEFKNSIKKKK